MHDRAETVLNPAKHAVEARCEDCGEVVASMTELLLTKYSAERAETVWFGLQLGGIRNHQQEMETQPCTTP